MIEQIFVVLMRISIVLLGALVFFGAWHLIQKYVTPYRFSSHEFQMLFLGVIPIFRIPYDAITDISEVDVWRNPAILFTAINIGNRMLARNAVVIIRNCGVLRMVIVTPDHPGEFIRNLRAKMGQPAFQ